MKYYQKLEYQSVNGALVKIKYDYMTKRNPRVQWTCSFNDKIVFGPFKNKFQTLLFASHKMKKSMKDCDWI